MTGTPNLEFIPIACTKRFERFDLAEVILAELGQNNIRLCSKDVLIVSSKFASLSEGRYVRLDKVRPSRRAKKLATSYHLDAQLAELIIRESDEILGGIPGFALAISRGVLAPNAGIDRSNIPKGYAIVYPKNPRLTAERLRRKLIETLDRSGKASGPELGVILSDSRVTPTRLGTVGVAIAAAGFNPVLDFRGRKDLFGNELKFTIRAVADQLATASQLIMGEASESIPVVIARGARVQFTDQKPHLPMTIGKDKCLIVQGLKSAYEHPEVVGH